MPAKKTQEQVINEFKEVHGDKYDYSKVEYQNNSTKVCIICNEKDENGIEHGEFWQTPCNHLQGVNCPKCGRQINKNIAIKMKEKSKQELESLLLDTPYKLIEYKTVNKSIGWCDKHNKKIYLNKNAIKNGSCPCKDCAKELGKLGESAFEKIKKIEKYYPFWEFNLPQKIKSYTRISGFCKKHNKKFTLSTAGFPNAGGCPICMNRKYIPFFKEEINNIIEKAYNGELKFINRYKNKYTCLIKKWNVIRTFDNTTNFRDGKTNIYQVYNTETFIAKCKIDFSSQLDYSNTNYVDNDTPIKYNCPYHGEVFQCVNEHIRSGAKCCICNHGMPKSFKLSLLEEVDLELMSENQLLELIKMGNLPKEFKTLIFSKPKSKKRKDDAKKLKEKYSDETKSEEETNKEIEEQIQEEEKKFEENNNNEQEDFALPELTEIQDIIDRTKIFDVDKLGISHGEGEKFIINSSLHELWNTALNSGDKFINQYKSETNTGKWFNCIRDMFFDEYNKVNSFIVDENCKFPYKPNLMQKLMVYKMKENNYYGNWSDAGAGKSFSRELTSRAIDAHVSLYIVPNAVKDTTKKSILEAYPNDSNIVFIENINDIVKLDETKYNYMIINYDKFQQEHTMDWINKLVETNKIDFICLDEIQNVKVSNINDVSIRNTMIRTLIENVKHINPNVKLLALSATPIINNLTEVRMLMELLTGNEYKEIGNKNTIENIHEAYKALLLNGFRFVPEYTAKMNPISICVNGDALSNDLMNISNSDISKIEQMLAELKIDECIKKGLIKDKTIIYTHYVDGIVPMLRNEIESLGLKVDCYTGEEREQRKDIIDNFINGNLNVLIGSRPISTGVDGLQKVCNNMIIISAPWTNAEYHQLIKRIYRQGSLFKDVDVIIPKVYIDKWSWDERRIEIIEHKKTLGEAVLDGSFNFKKYDEDSFRTKLLSKAIEALNQGIEDKDVIRKKIEVEEIDIVKIQRSESYVNEIHRVANISKHENISKNVYGNDKNKFNEYHKHRQESIKSWVENPINYVADIINNRNEESYHDIIDMGCGLNQLKDLIINGDKRVVGVDFYSDDKNVIQSDMCDLNKYVPNKSKDICVFCLSLWGTNYEDYIKEANRIMKHGGILIIVEPYSKFGENKHYNTIDDFSAKIEKYGFEVLGRNTIRNNFVYFKFHKI